MAYTKQDLEHMLNVYGRNTVQRNLAVQALELIDANSRLFEENRSCERMLMQIRKERDTAKREARRLAGHIDRQVEEHRLLARQLDCAAERAADAEVRWIARIKELESQLDAITKIARRSPAPKAEQAPPWPGATALFVDGVLIGWYGIPPGSYTITLTEDDGMSDVQDEQDVGRLVENVRR